MYQPFSEIKDKESEKDTEVTEDTLICQTSWRKRLNTFEMSATFIYCSISGYMAMMCN
jgi:hypothetical protein